MKISRFLINTVLFFFLFFIVLILFNLPCIVSNLYNKVYITIYLKDRLGNREKEGLMKEINKIKSGIEISFISKENMLKAVAPPKVTTLLEKNPLFDSFKVKFTGKTKYKDFENLYSNVSSMSEIEKIIYPKQFVETVRDIENSLFKTLLILCGIYLFGMLIIQVLTSHIFARLSQEERGVFYLSGKTKFFLLFSSLTSCITYNLISSLAAISLLFLAWTFFPNNLPFLFGEELHFFSYDIILSLIGIGILFGFISFIPTIGFL